MGKPRRAQPSKFRVELTNPEWVAVGICPVPTCRKKMYRSKKAAKSAARVHHPNDKMSPYQCRSTSELRPNPAPWHLGHLMEEIKRGDSDRYAVYVNHEKPKIRETKRQTSVTGTDYLRGLVATSKTK